MQYGLYGPSWDFNGPVQENGAGFYQFTTRGGERRSLSKAYLHPALGRSNLTVQSGAIISRIIIESG